MIISSLHKKRNDVDLFFENGSKIILDYRVVIDNRLKPGDSLSEETIKYLINRSELNRIKDQAFRFLSFRHHSSHELKLKLIKKNHPKNLIEEVISELIENKYLNDYDFAKSYIEEKITRKKSGSIKLKSGLMQKGVDRNIIDNLIVNLDLQLSFDNAFLLAQKKYNQLIQKEQDKNRIRQKLFTYLINKGFENDIIMPALNRLLVIDETGK